MLIGTGLYNNLFRNAGTLYQLNRTEKTRSKEQSAGSAGSSIRDYYKTFEKIKLSQPANIVAYQQENASNLRSLKSASFTLSNAARSLHASNLGSTDNNVVSIEGSIEGLYNDTFDIFVHNTASDQLTATSWKMAEEETLLEPGEYSFEINSKSGRTQIELNVVEGQSNIEVFENLSAEINKAENSGVNANIGRRNENIRLELNSLESGLNSGFDFITDGNTHDVLGFKTLRDPMDASYIINGQGYFSDSNSVPLPQGNAYLTLNGTGSAQIRPVVDSEQIIASAQNFANSYNNIIDYINLHPDSNTAAMRSFSIVNGTNTMSRAGLSRLSAIGITIGSNGMEIDAEKMKSAVEASPDTVKNALAGYNSVTNSIGRQAGRAINSMGESTSFISRLSRTSLLSSVMPQSGFLFDLAV